MKTLSILVLMLAACTTETVVPAGYMKAELIAENQVRLTVNLQESYTVIQTCGVNGVSVEIGTLFSANPCDKEVSALLNGNPPEWYGFELRYKEYQEFDTVFLN